MNCDKPVVVGVEISDRPCGDAAFHRRPRHRGRHRHHEARIERFRDQVFRAERQRLASIGQRDDVGELGVGELGNRFHAGELHLLGDHGRADVERAAEDERKAQHVVDLVRVVRAARRDDGVRSHGLGELGPDFGLGVRQGEDQRIPGHGPDHVLRQHAGAGKTEKEVGAANRVGQRAVLRVAGVARLVLLHRRLAAGVDDAPAVAHDDVLAGEPDADHEIEAGDRRRTRAGAHELDLRDVLADHLEPVQDRCAGHDRGAVLVVVEDRDLHPLAQLALDVEAVRCLDVLEVDAAERRLQPGDGLDHLLRVGLGELDVEHIDAGEFLEQAGLAFHDRLARQRPDVAQAEHRGAVGDHGDEIATRRKRRASAGSAAIASQAAATPGE